jgi:transcriptional activator of cad operon
MAELPDARGERLESWKKIAAYLRRDVRTVQRWEENGLPVHRHQRAQRPIPYAYTKELDEWWTRHSVSGDPPRAQRRKAVAIVAAAALVAIIGGAVEFWIFGRDAAPSGRSVAVLPFIDLSEDMAYEEFADGVTEELIGRLNRIPGLRVPAPTSTFFYKNKQVPVADIGRSLHVAYVVDGSVRRSGERVRVAVRLIRAATDDVVWSESYDRQWNDMLAVQDDIASNVTRALERSLR